MLCGSFSESKGKKLVVKDVDGKLFTKALDLWCGRKDCQEVELGEVQQLGVEQGIGRARADSAGG